MTIIPALMWSLVLVCQTAVRKYHKVNRLNRNVLSHSFGGQKSKIKMLIPSEGDEGELFPGLSSFWWFGVRLWLAKFLDLQAHLPDLCFHVHVVFPPCSVCVQISLSYKKNSHIGVRARSTAYDLILTKLIHQQ